MKGFTFALLTVCLLLAFTPYDFVNAVKRDGLPGKEDISMEIQSSAISFSRDRPVLFRMVVNNLRSHSRSVPKWFVPLDGNIEENLFRVIFEDGTVSHYLGLLAKRPPPTEEDMEGIPARASKNSAFFPLSTYYDFSKTGNYEVSYEFGGIKSASVKVFVEGRKAAAAEGKPDGGFIDDPNELTLYSSKCTKKQRNRINLARTQATTYSVESTTYMQALDVPGSSLRYANWFGAPDAAHHAAVAMNFDKIRVAFQTERITFDCGCKKRYYAYVYPYLDSAKTIYLCKFFWQAPTAGTDSKGGTLVHEMSHFNNIAVTDDVEYGYNDCLVLAESSPQLAVQNADNHEYFAENTPFFE